MLKVVGASWKQIRISTWIIGVVFVLGIIAIILGETSQSNEDGNYSATVYWYKDSGFRIEFWGQGMELHDIPQGVARAYYQPHVATTGWAMLNIETQENFPDWVQAYAAGFLEGTLSWQLIYWHWQNTVQNTCDGREQFCEDVRQYLVEITNWAKEESRNKEKVENDEAAYWHQVQLFFLQLDGVVNGFAEGIERSRQDDIKIDALDFLWMNAVSDLTDLEYKFNGTRDQAVSISSSVDQSFTGNSVLLNKIKRSIDNLSKKSDYSSTKINQHRFDCGFEGFTLSSAFVKIVAEEGQLFVAHNSAGPYSGMLKMMKHYTLRYHVSLFDYQPIPGSMSSFSSYPAAIHSMDDYYIIRNDKNRHQLAVTGTPITIFNSELWDKVSSTNQILIGPRVTTANRLATGGRSWSQIVEKYPSGTANQEWVIVDIGRFEEAAQHVKVDNPKYKKKMDELTDILWVVEQIPGLSSSSDETDLLKSRTYWASYGLPYFADIAESSGIAKMYEIYGDAFSYNETALAQIFRRDEKNATNMTSITKLMRSNSYKIDPLSFGNPRCAVGSRGDVHSEVVDPEPEGVTDAKVFSSKTFKNMEQRHVIRNNTFTIHLRDLGKPKENTQTQHRFQITAGPAYSIPYNIGSGDEDDDDLEPFNWAKSQFVDTPHVGQPDVWDFQSIKLF